MFTNREEAGKLLGEKLNKHLLSNAIVFGIARGGMVVGYQIARMHSLPFSPLVVKKIPSPMDQELAMGAIAPEGVYYLDREFVKRNKLGQSYVSTVMKICIGQLEERERLYHINHFVTLQDKTAILTDDGIATGATAQVAIQYLRTKSPRQIILAVPVVGKDTFQKLQSMVELVVALTISDSLSSVGQFYKHFEQVTDKEVLKLL